MQWVALDKSYHSDLYIVLKGILHLGRRDDNTDLLPGTLHMMILRTLQKEPMHGYAIAKRIRDWSKGDIELEDGSLYPPSLAWS